MSDKLREALEDGGKVKTIEEKVAELTARWNEFHKPAEKKPLFKPIKERKPETGRQALEPIKTPDDDKPKATWNEFFRRMGLDGPAITIKKPDGVVNDSYNLAHLKEPVTWFGNVAVGEDPRWAGWWNIVAPSSIMVSFFGEGAKERALKQGEELKPYYL